MSWQAAQDEMRASRRFWNDAVYEAFMDSVPALEKAA
jgi:hypothetical protein